MPAVLYILFGAGFTVASSIAAGRLLLNRMKLPFDRGEHLLFSFLTGSSLLSLAIFVLCSVGLARKGIFLILGLCLLATLRRRMAVPAEPLPKRWKMLLLTVGGAYTVLYFFNALAPEISPDGSTYHLGLVARYLREHGFHRITNDFHASFSEGVEMLYLFAFAFGRHSAAAMVHFAFLPALTAMMILYARRSGMVAAGVCAALFVFASPVFGVDGTSAYNDVATATIAFGLFYLLQIWDAERTSALAIPIGLIAGFAYAAKFTAAVAIPYALAFVAWRSWRSRRPFLKPLLVIGACVLLMVLPWMIKNWLWVANPFSPFFNAVFPNPYIQLGFEKELAYHMHHYEGIRRNLDLPWVITIDGRLSGFLGPLFLLCPLALLTLRQRQGRQLLLAALAFAGPYLMNFGPRFLMPAAVFLALCMAMVLMRWPAVAAAVVLLHAVGSWPSVTPLYCNDGSWRLHRIPVRAALRLEPEDRYLSAHLVNYNLARLIERTVPPGGKVLSFSQIAQAYTSREILVIYQSAQNQMLGDILWAPFIPQYMPNRILQFNLAREPLRAVRVLQTARSATEGWSITDLSVFPPAAATRINAQPNPWELPMAFDGKPVTRWRTWLPMEPGQFVELDFGQPQPVERIELQCSRDQPDVRLRLEGADASGHWRPLDAVMQEREISVPNLRRQAVEELKARGVDYLMIFGYDYGVDDFRLRAGEWGIRQVAELGNDRLYRLEPGSR